MSVSVGDKIELFRNMIFKEIEESASERILKAAEGFEQEKARLLQEAEIKKNHIVEEAVKKAEKEKQQFIAKAKSEAHRRLLDKKQLFISEIRELLVQKAKSYVHEEGYKGYLTKSLGKAAEALKGSDLIRIYFTKDDLKDLGDFINQSITSSGLNGRCRLMEAGQNIIGGFFAEDEKQEVQLDFTLKSLIDENQELIGSYISRRLDEVQGNGK